jgi:hypothetical protein
MRCMRIMLPGSTGPGQGAAARRPASAAGPRAEGPRTELRVESGAVPLRRSTRRRRREEPAGGRTSADWSGPNAEAGRQGRVRRRGQHGHRLPVDNLQGRGPRGHSLSLGRFAIAARLGPVEGRARGARPGVRDGETAMSAVPTAMPGFLAHAAGHPTLVALAVEAPPRRVHAGSAVGTTPGAGGWDQAGDQESYQRGEYNCRADRRSHGFRRLWAEGPMPSQLLYRMTLRVSPLPPCRESRR